MKKELINVVIIISLFCLLDCNNKSKISNKADTDCYANQKRIYEMALKYDDLDASRNAIY